MWYESPRTVRKVIAGIAVTGCMILLLGMWLNRAPLIVLGFVVLCGGSIFNLLFYRCPYCEKHLGRSNGEYCPYCGSKMG